VTVVSIFMALMTISVSPAFTRSPDLTAISTIVPPIGDSTASSPSGTACEGADGAALGSQQPGHVADHFPGHVEDGTMGDHGRSPLP